LSYSVVVFCKPPIAGLVKTRLASTIGNAKALLVYKLLTESVVSAIPPTNLVAYTSRLGTSAFDSSQVDSSQVDSTKLVADWLHCKAMEQRGDGLGERMINAFQDEIERGFTVVVIVGSDTVYLTFEHLQDAVDALKSNAVVFGPSTDGGFYLIGINADLLVGGHSDERDKKSVVREKLLVLFEGVEWSTENVLDVVLENVEELENGAHENIERGCIGTLSDIDTVQDLTEAIQKTPDQFSELALRLKLIVESK